jgi:hypothetical protein
MGPRRACFLFLIIIPVVVVTTVLFFVLSNDDNGRAEKNSPEQTPMSTKLSTGTPPVVEIGEILIMSKDIKRVVDVNSITLPNCDGSSELGFSRQLNRETKKEIHIQADPSITFSIPLDLIKTTIEAYFGTDESESITETITVQMSAAPGTTVTYDIEWIEVSIGGMIELIYGPDSYFQEFSIVSSLEANIREPRQTVCSTPTP